MACCNATTATLPAIGTPDPGQHVNFVKGMVLGVADYVQEHAYLVGRSEWMARDLIGYGTASGLAVRVEDDGTNGPRVHISAGSAVAPSGKMICVGRDQCGSINGWLSDKTNAATVAARVSGSPPADRITLYLTLCYRDCAIAPIPVPGEPCRSDENLMQPSRIADDYCLDYRLEPPAQWEADAIGTFSAWLDEIADAIESEGSASPPLGPDQWTGEIRAALDAITGDFLDGSPPVASSPMVPPLPSGLSTDDYDDFLRLAYRLWITEYRPKVMAQRCGDGEARATDCVLLAALDVAVDHSGDNADSGWTVDGDAVDVVVDERRRPLIAPLHLVQTALGIMSDSGGFAGWPSPPTSPPGGWPTSPPGGWPSPPDAPPGGWTSPPDAPPGGWPTQPPGGWPTDPPAGWPTQPPGGWPTSPPAGWPTQPPGGWPSTPPGGWPTEPPGGWPAPPTASAGPFRLRTVATSGDVRLDDKIDCLITIDDTKVELPSVREAENGRSYYIKALAETSIRPQPGEILELLFLLPDRRRQTELVLSDRQSIQLVCDEENGRWLIISDFQPQLG